MKFQKHNNFYKLKRFDVLKSLKEGISPCISFGVIIKRLFKTQISKTWLRKNVGYVKIRNIYRAKA